MTEIMLTKSFGKLAPVDPTGEGYLRNLKAGEVVKVRISKPRNAAFHRKYFALLHLGYENQDLFKDFERWRRACIIEAGYYVDLRRFDGTVDREAKSISFGQMDELEFSRLYEATVGVIAAFIGTDDDTLAREVEQFLTVGG